MNNNIIVSVRGASYDDGFLKMDTQTAYRVALNIITTIAFESNNHKQENETEEVNELLPPRGR